MRTDRSSVEGKQSVMAITRLMALLVASEHKGISKEDFTTGMVEAEDILTNLGYKMPKKLGVYVEKYKPGDRKNGERLDEFGDAVEELAKKIIKQYAHDPDVNHDAIALLKRTYRAFYNAEDIKDAGRHIHHTEDPALFKLYVTAPDKKKINDVAGELEYVVKQLGGKNLVVTKENIDNADRRQNKQIERYKQLRKQYLLLSKEALRYVVGDKEYMPLTEAEAALNKMGIKTNFPQGFKGAIDRDGKLRTSKGVLLGTPPTNGSKVEMNKAYNEKDPGNAWYCKYLPVFTTTGDWVPSYTVNWQQHRRAHRDSKVEKILSKGDSARRKWLSDLKNGDHNHQMLAALSEILYTFGIRAGTPGNAKNDKETYGLTTIKADHVRFLTDRVRLTYPGKDGVPQKHDIKTHTVIGKLIFKVLKRLYDDAENKHKPLFMLNGTRRADPQQVVNYLSSKGLSGVTMKDFRRFRGSKIFMEEMEKARIGQNIEPEALGKRIKGIAEKVGEILGHKRTTADGDMKVTGATAISAYIMPKLMLAPFEERGIRPPNFLQKFVQDAD